LLRSIVKPVLAKVANGAVVPALFQSTSRRAGTDTSALTADALKSGGAEPEASGGAVDPQRAADCHAGGYREATGVHGVTGRRHGARTSPVKL